MAAFPNKVTSPRVRAEGPEVGISVGRKSPPPNPPSDAIRETDDNASFSRHFATRQKRARVKLSRRRRAPSRVKLLRVRMRIQHDRSKILEEYGHCSLPGLTDPCVTC